MLNRIFGVFAFALVLPQAHSQVKMVREPFSKCVTALVIAERFSRIPDADTREKAFLLYQSFTERRWLLAVQGEKTYRLKIHRFDPPENGNTDLTIQHCGPLGMRMLREPLAKLLAMDLRLIPLSEELDAMANQIAQVELENAKAAIPVSYVFEGRTVLERPVPSRRARAFVLLRNSLEQAVPIVVRENGFGEMAHEYRVVVTEIYGDWGNGRPLFRARVLEGGTYGELMSGLLDTREEPVVVFPEDQLPDGKLRRRPSGGW